MDKDVKMLSEIHQGVLMGVVGIEKVLDKAEDSAFRSALMQRMNIYQDFLTRAETLLKEKQADIKDLTFARMMLRTGTSAKLMADDSVSNMAEMMMEGNNQVIIQMTRALKEPQGISQEVLSLGKDYLKNAEEGLEKMKAFL